MPNKTQIQFEPVEFEPIDETQSTASVSFEPTVETPVDNRGPFDKFSVGVGKRILKTGRNLGQFGNTALNQTVGRGVNALQGKGFTPGDFGPEVYKKDSPAATRFEGLVKPEGVAENLGFMAGTIAEFLAGGRAMKPLTTQGVNLVKDAPKYAKTLSTAVKSVSGAIEGGGITTIQRGEFDNEAKVNALIGAVIPPVAEGLKALSTRITRSVIKPTSADYKDGFNTEVINKYNLRGSLDQTAIKTEKEIQKTFSELKTTLKGSNSQVNLNTVFQKTADELKGNRLSLFGQNKMIGNAVEELGNEITDVTAETRGTVDLYSANLIKQGAGRKGAWAFGVPDRESIAAEKVYTTFYKHLKTAIEDAGDTEAIRAANKKLSELIPVMNAVIRRIPVAERQNILSLSDSMGLFSSLFDPRALALIGTSILSKSGRFANFLYNVASGSAKGIPTAAVQSQVSGAE